LKDNHFENDGIMSLNYANEDEKYDEHRGEECHCIAIFEVDKAPVELLAQHRVAGDVLLSS
jgi:hypothetical protein